MNRLTAPSPAITDEERRLRDRDPPEVGGERAPRPSRSPRSLERRRSARPPRGRRRPSWRSAWPSASRSAAGVVRRSTRRPASPPSHAAAPMPWTDWTATWRSQPGPAAAWPVSDVRDERETGGESGDDPAAQPGEPLDGRQAGKRETDERERAHAREGRRADRGRRQGLQRRAGLRPLDADDAGRARGGQEPADRGHREQVRRRSPGDRDRRERGADEDDEPHVQEPAREDRGRRAGLSDTARGRARRAARRRHADAERERPGGDVTVHGRDRSPRHRVDAVGQLVDVDARRRCPPVGRRRGPPR